MNLISYAAPFFALSMLAELIWDYRRGTGYYRLNDAISSLSLGILSTTSKLVIYGFGTAVLLWIGDSYGIWDVSLESPLAWVLTFIGYDLLYYWYHRICHERQLFWASHVAHHQSEEYNLSTALRQTSMSFIYAWLFFIPCFIAGVPAEMYFTVGALNLLYQFWVHTRHLPKLGWLEWVFITPSNHRVHHARNPRYVDRNYGGVFILWDRLFGTFQAELEEEPVEFGISKPLASWNPVRANLHIFQKMWRECLATGNLRDKFYIWISPTGWQPRDLPPPPPTDLSVKYDPPCSAKAKAYALFLLLFMYAWAGYYIFNFAAADFQQRLLGFAFILTALLEASAALENRLTGYWATLRRLTNILCAAALGGAVGAPYHYLYVAYVLLLLGGRLALATAFRNSARQPAVACARNHRRSSELSG